MTSQVKLSEQIIPKYYGTFNDIKHTHKIFTSGRAGTKSSRAAIKGLFKIISDDDCSVVAMRKFHNKLKKTIYKEYLRAFGRLGLDKKDFKITTSPMEIKYLENGNTIYFTGNDSIDDTKGMIDESKPIKLVQIDELTEFFERGDGEDELVNIEATFVRGNDEEFCMEYYFNPPKNEKAPIMEWTNKMEQREDTIRIHTTYKDVPDKWLGKKLIDSAEELKRMDLKMYNWLWLGECTGLDELIYYMFDESVHVKEPTLDSTPYLCVGVDYGQMNATTFQCFGIDYQNKMVCGVDEYYHSGRESGHQRSPSEYARDFKAWKDSIEFRTGKKIRYVYIDPSARGLAEEIKRESPEVSIRGAENSVLLGINRVQKLMSMQHITFSPTQKNLIGEMFLYEWDSNSLDRGKETPVKQNDHCQDATRYVVMGLWKYIRQILPMVDDGKGEEYECNY